MNLQSHQNYGLGADPNVNQSQFLLPQQNLNNQFPMQNFAGGDDFRRKRWNISLQTMAADDRFPVENLTRVLHLFVTGKASDWFWIYKQNNPLATWREMRNAMVSYFNSYESEEETKEQIIRRFQGAKESFSDFALDIQKLNGRLNHRMTECELIGRLCQNMHPALRNVTLAHQANFRTIEELRVLCERFEKHWNRTKFDPRDSYNSQFRRHHHLNELEYGSDFFQPFLNQAEDGISFLSPQSVPSPQNENHSIDAIQNGAKPSDGNFFLVCWNCKDIGHRYQDCSQAQLHEFCFGCGLANVRKFNCLRCQKKILGNSRPGVNQMREPRSDPTSMNVKPQENRSPSNQPSNQQ